MILKTQLAGVTSKIVFQVIHHSITHQKVESSLVHHHTGLSLKFILLILIRLVPVLHVVELRVLYLYGEWVLRKKTDFVLKVN